MGKKLANIMILLCAVAILLFSAHAEARIFMTGAAELSYVNFDSKADNPLGGTEDRFSGDGFAQKYSLTWNATNLFHRTQMQYYDVAIGYDWLTFDTKISDNSAGSRLKDAYGRFRYRADFGYNPINIPIQFRIYANEGQPLSFDRDINQLGIITDGLFRGVSGRSRSESFGTSFTFDPDLARTQSLRGLPRLHLDYRETFNKSLTTDFAAVDNVTRELAVAGLSKQNNWVHYRNLIFEDHLTSSNNFEQQQLQIGLVDYKGRRLWSSLTNWIDVSADGQLSDRKSTARSEEYDVNFMAIATRRTWQARTFMNYNRLMTTSSDHTDSTLTESARVPLYVRGTYSIDTDWFMSVAAGWGTHSQSFPNPSSSTSRSESVSVGGTTFKRSKFTLSSSFSAATSKNSDYSDSLSLKAVIETSSTSRYSNKLDLAAQVELGYLDDGSNSIISKSWHNKLNMKANYLPDSKFRYMFNEVFESGEETVQNYTGLKTYVQTITTASVLWTPMAELTSSLQASYDLRKNETSVANTRAEFSYRLAYSKKEISYNIYNKFSQSESNYTKSSLLSSSGNFNYKPDRHNQTTLRYNYSLTHSGSTKSTVTELIESYNYNFYTRTGVLRNFATVTQDIGYKNEESGSWSSSTQYLQLSGRYSPIEKLSLTGSVRYEDSNPGSVMISYNAGVNADFKLFSTALNYAYAKRDSDHRIEKKVSASVRRSF